MCNGDTYNTHLGSILTCSNCSTRHHSKCMWPGIERDGRFSALSWQGKYLCKNCMTCVTCQRPIDKDVYRDRQKTVFLTGHDAFDIPETDAQNPECDTVKCLGCGHFASHKRCLPEGSSADSWRCDSCLLCKHCGAVEVPRKEWDERTEACTACFSELRRGGVVCPVCLKVYREGENIPMVQCDYCDKWLHALDCAGLSMEKFHSLSGSDVKYRCPICTKEKKARELERRRARLSGTMYKANGFGAGGARKAADPKLILQQMPIEERELTFHSVRRAAVEDGNFEEAFSLLAPDVEVCRLCCSGGKEEDMLFCADCGECYHDYCYNSGAATPFGKPLKTLAVPVREDSLLKRHIVNDVPGEDRAWRCFECESFKRISKSPRLEAKNGMNTAHTPNGIGSSDEHPFLECNGNGLVHGSRIAPLHLKDVEVVDPKPMRWNDRRACELCEYAEDRNGKEGRLMPWASITSSDSSHCWVHAGCLLWSYGVSLHGSDKSFDVLLGPRRSLLHFAKTNTCEVCKESGATLVCSWPGCEQTFHFRCALDLDVGCELKFVNDPAANTVPEKVHEFTNMGINLVNLVSLRMFCPAHRLTFRDGKVKLLPLAEAHGLVNLRRGLKVFDTQGFSMEAERPNKKPLSPDRLLSIRVGSLSVLHFGRLVPEVDDFIVNGWLIPIGYCAARRFWSLLHPEKRCLYYFEVCGYPQSGPVFVIRCSDCILEKFESKDPDEAWNSVLTRVSKARERTKVKDSSYFSFHISGLEAFGLANCIPVVTHVESLPMASMFAGRYHLKRVATHRSDEVVFYNSLAKKFVPVKIRKNMSGSARSEGYASNLWRRKNNLCLESVPAYENARTGSSFQLQVAREVFAKTDHVHPQASHEDRGKFEQSRLLASKATSFSLDRSRANKSTTPSLPFATQHRSIASTSRNRTVILRSDIDGCGVFATKDIPAGEMIVEYVGEIIRPVLSDIREAQYLEKGIGCYMFQIEPGLIVDATMRGNAARYINHSCEPNCYSKTITIESDRKVVVIFAKRHIQRGEELSYDYQFPPDEADRVKCGCGTERCKGWMN